MPNIAIIPARGGSRRIPDKNIKLFHGKPIIAYSIMTAQESSLFDRIIVSTDDDEIAQVATYYAAEVLARPAGLALDKIGTQEVAASVLDALDVWDGYACCIYTTAPMMTTDDLREGLSALRTQGAEFSMAVGAEPLRDAGQWYWGKIMHFRNRDALIAPWTAMVPIPENRVCDINTPEDWARAEKMYEALHAK